MSAKAARLRPRPTLIKAPVEGPFRIRVAGAYQPREPGFVGIDRLASDSVDHVVDLKTYPWPIDDAVVDFVYSAFYFHRLTLAERGAFMDEVCRILKPGGQMAMVVPHWSSMRAITDPLAQWPPLCESSFMVYCREWREQERMTDLPLTCDFAAEYGYGHSYHPQFTEDLIGRNDEFVQKAKDRATHEVNTITDLHVTMTKKVVPAPP